MIDHDGPGRAEDVRLSREDRMARWILALAAGPIAAASVLAGTVTVPVIDSAPVTAPSLQAEAGRV